MSKLMNVSKNGNHVNNSWSSLIDGLFNMDTFPSIGTNHFNSGYNLPQVNIKETDDDYFIELAVPGLQKEDFTIDLDHDVLSISTEQKSEDKTLNSNYTRKEFSYTSFKRTFTLPDFIDDGKIKAAYEAGILSIQLPKQEEAKPKPAKTIKIS